MPNSGNENLGQKIHIITPLVVLSNAEKGLILSFCGLVDGKPFRDSMDGHACHTKISRQTALPPLEYATSSTNVCCNLKQSNFEPRAMMCWMQHDLARRYLIHRGH